jgi:hypothetical protein
MQEGFLRFAEPLSWVTYTPITDSPTGMAIITNVDLPTLLPAGLAVVRTRLRQSATEGKRNKTALKKKTQN